MTWDTLQQFLRIVLQLVAGNLIAAGYLHADDAQAFIGGALSISGFAWWAIWERKRPDTNAEG